MSKRNGPIEEVKKKYVRMALESGNYAFVARKTGVSPKTLSSWVKSYRDEVEKEMSNEEVSPLTSQSSNTDYEAKYKHAIQLLGEKELEVAMLREQLKKKFPGYPNV